MCRLKHCCLNAIIYCNAMERLLLWVLFICFSVIAYSVIMGALMASGKEVSGKIPKGKVSIKALGKDVNLRKEP